VSYGDRCADNWKLYGVCGFHFAERARAPFVGILLGLCRLAMLYSSFAKKIVILDVVVIAIGFVMRSVCRGVAISVEVSPWLVLMTFLLALFLAWPEEG